ncbi:unnamed protein product, partial [Prorocentrum cordatum]
HEAHYSPNRPPCPARCAAHPWSGLECVLACLTPTLSWRSRLHQRSDLGLRGDDVVGMCSQVADQRPQAERLLGIPCGTSTGTALSHLEAKADGVLAVVSGWWQLPLQDEFCCNSSGYQPPEDAVFQCFRPDAPTCSPSSVSAGQPKSYPTDMAKALVANDLTLNWRPSGDNLFQNPASAEHTEVRQEAAQIIQQWFRSIARGADIAANATTSSSSVCSTVSDTDLAEERTNLIMTATEFESLVQAGALRDNTRYEIDVSGVCTRCGGELAATWFEACDGDTLVCTGCSSVTMDEDGRDLIRADRAWDASSAEPAERKAVPDEIGWPDFDVRTQEEIQAWYMERLELNWSTVDEITLLGAARAETERGAARTTAGRATRGRGEEHAARAGHSADPLEPPAIDGGSAQ